MKIVTTAKYDDVPDKFFLEGVAEEEYLDDAGTHFGLSIEHPLSDVSITLRSEIPVKMKRYVFNADDHQLHKLLGKRLRITVEVLEDSIETS